MADNNHSEVLEAIQTLATHVDKQIDNVRNEIGEVRGEIGDVRKDLGGQIGKLRSELIDHVTRTVNNARGDIIQSIKTDRERHKLFHEKILNIFVRSKLAEPEEVEVLRELVA